MKTYTVNAMQEMEQFKTDYGYNIKGNLICNCSIMVEGLLLVEGSLSIKVGESIKVGGSIKAGGYIKAGESIEAGWSYGISAG